MSKPSHLGAVRLLPRDPPGPTQRLAARLSVPGTLLPADPSLLGTVLGCSREEAGDAVESLLRVGAARRVIVGRESHLAGPAGEPPEGEPSPDASSVAESAFLQELALDAEREKLLLYKVLLALLAVLTLAVLRGAVLQWIS